MAWWQWGDAQASRLVVCVHGLTRQGRDFDVLARALVAQAERDYAALRAGRLRNVAIRNGQVVEVPLAERLNPLWKLSLGARYYLLAAFGPVLAAALLPMALHLGWQVATLVPDDGGNALARFRANRFAGLLMFLACLVVGTHP